MEPAVYYKMAFAVEGEGENEADRKLQFSAQRIFTYRGPNR